MIFILFILLLIICYIDIKEKIIYDGMILVGILIALHYQLLSGNIEKALIGIDVGIGIMWFMNIIKIQKVGGGDVKLMAMIGAFLGWKIVLCTSLIAWVIFLPFKCILKQKIHEVAYSPYILASFILVIICQTVVLFLKA